MADSHVRESAVDIAAQIEAQVRESVEARAEVIAELDRTAKEIQKVARSFAPVRTGRYGAGIKVRKRPDENGLPVRRVVATDFKSHWIEYGTGEPGPTKASAPMEKAANAFGGTVDGPIHIGNDSGDEVSG